MPEEKLIDQLRRFMRFVNDPRSRWEGFQPERFGPEVVRGVTCVYAIPEPEYSAWMFFVGYMSELPVDQINEARAMLDAQLQRPEAIDLPVSEWAEKEFQFLTTSPNAKPPKRYQRLSQPPELPIIAEVDGETLELRSGPLPDGEIEE